MSPMASQITSHGIVYITVYSGADKKNHQSSASLAFVRAESSPGTGEFPAQKASNAENVSIWWRNHVNIAVTSHWLLSVTNGCSGHLISWEQWPVTWTALGNFEYLPGQHLFNCN